jgi:hypothetical protein
VAPDDLIRDELDSWPGVRTLAVDLGARAVEVAVTDEAPAIAELVDALADRGIHASVTE